MPLSPDGMGQAVIRNLRNRTGKNLEQWIRVAKKTMLTEPQALRKWLKTEYGFGGTTCWIISDATLGKPEPLSNSAMLDAQFRGERAAIRPVYDRLALEVKKLGSDLGRESDR